MHWQQSPDASLFARSGHDMRSGRFICESQTREQMTALLDLMWTGHLVLLIPDQNLPSRHPAGEAQGAGISAAGQEYTVEALPAQP